MKILAGRLLAQQRSNFTHDYAECLLLCQDPQRVGGGTSPGGEWQASFSVCCMVLAHRFLPDFLSSPGFDLFLIELVTSVCAWHVLSAK